MNYVIGTMYTFNTLAPSVLGTKIERHTVRGIVDYTTACQISNIDILHRQIYPLLPSGTVDNPKKYTYLLLRSESDINRVVATCWIDETTVTEVTELTATITVTLDSNTQVTALRDSLNLMGYKFTMSVTES